MSWAIASFYVYPLNRNKTLDGDSTYISHEHVRTRENVI